MTEDLGGLAADDISRRYPASAAAYARTERVEVGVAAFDVLADAFAAVAVLDADEV